MTTQRARTEKVKRLHELRKIFSMRGNDYCRAYADSAAFRAGASMASPLEAIKCQWLYIFSNARFKGCKPLKTEVQEILDSLTPDEATEFINAC